jgi:hypothetical protein
LWNGGGKLTARRRCTSFQAYRDVSDLPFRKNPQLRIDMQAEVPNGSAGTGAETFESVEY